MHQQKLVESKPAPSNEKIVEPIAEKQVQEIIYLVKLLSEKKPESKDFDARNLLEIDKLKSELKKSEVGR